MIVATGKRPEYLFSLEESFQKEPRNSTHEQIHIVLVLYVEGARSNLGKDDGLGISLELYYSLFLLGERGSV